MNNIHCIPVGGAEPVHICHSSCWCHPNREGNVYTHNAKDCREKWERQGLNDGEIRPWVTVEENSNSTEHP